MSTLVAILNLCVVALYIMISVMSYFALRGIREHDKNNFDTYMIWSVLKDTFRMWILRDKKFELRVDGRGWAAAWLATSFFMSSSLLFAIMNLEYLLRGDIESVGVEATLMWFFTHTVSILGMIYAIYAAKHATVSRELDVRED